MAGSSTRARHTQLMAADKDFLCSYIDRSLNAPRLRSTATVAASSEGRIRMYHVQGNGAPEYALDGCQEADSEARNLYYQGTSGIVWLLPLMGLQTVNSLLAALLNSGEAGCCEPGQSDSGLFTVCKPINGRSHTIPDVPW